MKLDVKLERPGELDYCSFTSLTRSIRWPNSQAHRPFLRAGNSPAAGLDRIREWEREREREREIGGKRETRYVCKRSFFFHRRKAPQIIWPWCCVGKTTSSILRYHYLFCASSQFIEFCSSALYKAYTYAFIESIQWWGPNVGRMFHQILDSLGLITDRHTNSLFDYASFSDGNCFMQIFTPCPLIS